MPRFLPTWLPAAVLLAAASTLPMAQTPSSASAASAASTQTANADDPYLWLEDVQGDKALNWVRERNAQSRAQLQSYADFTKMRDGFRAILDSREKIPYVSRQGDWLYNFWRDAEHQRGLWRRTTLAEYRKPQPAWETVLDLDALGKAENENWVWSGSACLGPSYSRCLLRLSRGGADAVVVREFDTQTKRFVDGGFTLPEAKSQIDWIDLNTVYVGTNFGPGAMTDSGYPRIVKRWKRGQPLAEAVTVFEGQAKDVYAYASVDHTPGFERTTFGRALDFYHSEMSLLAGDKLLAIDRPNDSDFNFWRDKLLIQLRSDWKLGTTIWPSGSLLLTDAKAYLAGERNFTALFTPTATRSLAGVSTTRSRVLLNILDNVAGKLEEWQLADGSKGQAWQRREVKAPFPGTLGASSLHDPLLKDDPLAESYFVTYTDFLTPDSLMLGHTGTLSVYGKTKLAGEEAVQQAAADTFILRTAWVYAAGGRNFVLTMLKLMAERGEVRVVADQRGAPTWASSLAQALWTAAAKPAASGIHHWTDAGVASWYDFAVAIAEDGLAQGLLKQAPTVQPITTADYPTPARRPAYSVLDRSSTEELLGIKPAPWRDNLRKMLEEVAHA